MSQVDDFLGGKTTSGIDDFLGPVEKPGAIRRMADVALAFGQGAVGGTKALTDSTGAGTRVSGALDTASRKLGGWMSDDAQSEIAARQKTIKDAEASGSLVDEVGATLGGIAEAPARSIAQGAGSIVPTLAAAYLTRGKSLAAQAAPMGIGALQGAGAVKGSIYDAVKQKQTEAGMTPQQAQQAAESAQEYTGPNADNIAAGAGLGAFAGRFGAEGAIAGKGVSGSILRKIGITAGQEGLTEGAQGAQERLSANVAEQRQGFNTPTFQGVAGQGVGEGVIGGIVGGGVGAITGGPNEPPPAPLPPGVIPNQGQPLPMTSQRPVAPPAQAGTPAGEAPLPTLDQIDPSANATTQTPGFDAATAMAAPADPLKAPLPTIDPNAGPISRAASMLAGPGGVISAPVPQVTGKTSQGTSTGQPAAAAPAVGQKTTGAAQALGSADQVQSPLPPPVATNPTPVQSETPPKGPIAAAAAKAPAPAPVAVAPSPAVEDQPAADGAAGSAGAIKPGNGALNTPTPVSQPPQENASVPQADQAVQVPSQQPGSSSANIDPGANESAPGNEVAPGQVEPSAASAGPVTKPEPVQPAGGTDVAPTVEASKPTAPVDEAAHQAATSPLNDTPQPTQAQAKAGNYKKGHLNWKGLDLTFENPKGSERKGVDPSGKAWSVKMPAHYGYLKRSTGADGDQVDIYMGDYPESDRVFVVDQKDADTGKWDEHKVMLGTRSLFEATRLYDQGFSDGRGKQRRSAVTPMTMAEFKTWLKDGDTTKPVAARPKAPAQSGSATPEVAVGGQSAPQTQGQTERTPDSALPARAAGPSSASGGQGSASPDGTPDKLAKPPPKPTGGKNLRSAAYERNPFLTFLAQHGLFNDKDKPGSQKSEFSPDKFILVPGYGMVFRRTGLMPDVMVARAIEDGYLPKDGTESQLADLIRRAIAGEKIEPMYAEGVAEAKGQRMSDDRRALEEERQQEQNAIADVANLADPSVLDDDIPIDEASNTSTEAAMRSLGFTEQEIQDAITAGQGGAQEDRARGGEPDETQAAGPGEGDQGRPGAPPAGAEQEGLTAPTRADVLTQQDRAEAEAQRKADGGDKPAPPKPITADTPDMFNTQGSVFDQPAEPDAASFIPAPDGGIDYGEITDEMSKAMRRQAGKIRLQQGDKEFGLTHIQSRHGEQIQRMGFADVPAFVFDALQRIESIWKPDATSQLVVIQAEEKGRAVFIQLMPGKEDSGDFYTVNTAFPTGKGFAQNKDGWVSLWSREPVPAGDTGKPPSFAAPADETGQQGTMVSNQSEGGSVPQPPQDGNAATQVATILDAANVTGSEPTNDIEPDPEHNRLKGLSVSVEVPIDGGSAKVTHDAQRVMLDLDRRAQALEAVWERCK